MSSETVASTSEAANHQDTHAPCPTPRVNLERKARKEAQKALKAQQTADKKAAQASSATASQFTTLSTSSKAKDKNQRRPQSSTEQLSRALAYILRHGADKEGLQIRADGYVRLQDVLERPRVKSVNMAEGDEKMEERGNGQKRRPTVEDVRRIVQSNDKQRFELTQEGEQWWVRAVQGHSLKQVDQLEHTPLTLDNLDLLSTVPKERKDQPEDALCDEIDAQLGDLALGTQDRRVEVVHGTYPSAWEQILASGGLKPMTRNHIHLAKGRFGQKGVISGMRKSANRLIFVDIQKAMRDGIQFELSSNGVVLTKGDPATGVLATKYFTRVEDHTGIVVWPSQHSTTP